MTMLIPLNVGAAIGQIRHLVGEHLDQQDVRYVTDPQGLSRGGKDSSANGNTLGAILEVLNALERSYPTLQETVQQGQKKLLG